MAAGPVAVRGAARGDVVDAGAVRSWKGIDAVLALHGATRRRRLADLWEDATADPNHAKNVNEDASTTCRRRRRPAAGASSA